MTTTPSAARQDFDHQEHQRQVERQDAIAQLVLCCQAAATLHRRAPAEIARVAEMAQAALEAYQRTEEKP